METLPLAAGAAAVTMSSREIAELVDSRHDDVKRSIDRLVERGVIVHPPLADEPGTDALGRPRVTQVYRIGKRDSYVIVAQLSPEFTARLVDRWQELEAQQSRPLTPAELFLQNAQAMVALERQQIEQAARLAVTEQRLDQIETATDHFTCVGYARWAKKTSINLKDAAALGRIATKRCRELGIKVSKIPDPRFGSVNQFPKAILDEAWEEKFGGGA